MSRYTTKVFAAIQLAHHVEDCVHEALAWAHMGTGRNGYDETDPIWEIAEKYHRGIRAAGGDDGNE